MLDDVVVSMRHVTKVFNPGSPDELTAVRDIEIEIRRGEFLSLIGPSGCGKSTLLRLIGDLLPVSDGQVAVNGKSPYEARIDRDYAMVFQQATLLDWRTVGRNIHLPLEIMGHDIGQRRSKTKELLSLVDLEGFEDHYPWQLSGGMQQRVALARALSFEPSLLLMDEPFGALDEMTRERMQMELMRIWNQTQTTVVFVTHSIPEAVFLSTRVAVMSPRPGRISEVVEIDLPQPRRFETREMPEFFARVTEVREALRGFSEVE